jgi:hypothetical protein
MSGRFLALPRADSTCFGLKLAVRTPIVFEWRDRAACEPLIAKGIS